MPRPPEATLAWVEQTLGSGARVAGATRLTGGITSFVHRLTIDRQGKRERYVLRRFEPGEYYDAAWAVDAIARETAAFTALEKSGIPAPRLIGATTDQARTGLAVLMTLVPGRVYLMPKDRERWLRQMAAMLARIHALKIAAKPFESWLDRDRKGGPPDAVRPDIWRAAFALATDERPPAHTSFIHRDYQHFNLLWTRETLTGVVDWAGASTGPPDLDVGHCRLNLTLLFSADVAERFREMYEAEAGRKVDPRWDIHSLLSFGPDWQRFLPLQVDGKAPLDVSGMTRRMEDVLERVLRRA